ncbi:hypothetical protein HNP84_007354 [Thermocatellispora tengchongensis]|uniref:DNA-binding phage zinc finger domain-containing protein n=1 Tax=Thermocatellispora tengchongensis TaxID=1073253 RepID=A0A840PEJ9_9ACTN|nr:hypothetical protein [Thermocatellispora tengchongensis]MBB5137602.1 hypothetical protein [Thermocatellispora tengchongensis]
MSQSRRITLDQLAVDLDGAAVWLRDLSIAAERPAVPVELGENVCDRLEHMSKELATLARDVARIDTIITELQPLRPYLHQREPWGTRAHGSDREQWGKRLSTVLSMRQIIYLAADDLPWRDEEPGIPYLAGIEGLPDLEEWESPRAARRREAARQAAIQEQALQETCTTCSAQPGRPCVTSTGRTAELYHKPRIKAATAEVDAALAAAEEGTS